VISESQDGKVQKTGKSSSIGTPQEIADKIQTLQQFRALERRMERAEERYANADNNRAIEEAEKRHEILIEAWDIAREKPFRWQYIPNLSPNTPLRMLKHAYKVFPADKYEEAKREIGGSKNDWYALRGEDEREEKEPCLNGLKRFREIVEGDLPQDEQVKKINMLCSRSRDFAEEFFYDVGEMKPGDKWFAGILDDDGLPLAYELYKEGIKTPEDALKIDPNEFSGRKGVGQQRVQKLVEYQEKVRRRMSGG